jgi:hypothetical protein
MSWRVSADNMSDQALCAGVGRSRDNEPASDRRLAALSVASHAKDAEDCAHLLAMLGLTADESEEAG